MPRGHIQIMENTENKKEQSTTTVSAELNPQQFAFLTDLQKKHEQELGIEVPIGAMLRKVVDNAMTVANRPKDDRPPRKDKPFGDKPPRGDKPVGRSFDRPGFKPGPRKPFGARDGGGGGGGPKFSMLGAKNKTKSFDK